MNRDAQGCRTIRLRTLLKWSGLVLLLVVAIGFWKREFLYQQFRAQLLGNLELSAEKFGSELARKADAVEVFEIDESGKATNSVSIKIGGRVHNYDVVAGRNLASAEAKAFLERWGYMSFDWRMGGLCHEPAFVVRFLKNGKPELETTLCFMCHNFWIPTLVGRGTHMGFDQNSPSGQEFVAQVRGLFPDSPKWVALDEEENERREAKRRHNEVIGNPPLH